MAKKRVFISHDYDNDSGLVVLLAGQAKNNDSPFDYTDASVKQALTGDWKEKVKARIRNCDIVVVMCGEGTHNASGVATELAIAQELGKSYFLLWGYGDKTCTKPKGAKDSDKIYKWNWDNLKKLIGGDR
jgi:hypothetical protein